MQAAGQWILILIISLSLFALGPVKPSAGADLPGVYLPASGAPVPEQQSAQLRLLAPNACPSAGCAPGQRLSLRFMYNPSTYDAAKSPNIKVCVFAPPDWKVNPKTVTPGKTGVVTGVPYTSVAALTCAEDTAKPANYVTILEETAVLAANVPGDALDFSPRLGAEAAGPGQFVARLFEQNADGTWTRTASVTSDIFTMAAGAKTGFVAIDASACGQSSPCYINSGDDLAGGLGTGLKDAVDGMPGGSVIQILGAYPIKSKAVLVNHPQTIKGTGASTLTFNGPGACDSPMLTLSTKVTLQDLTINDGVCSTPGRSLVEVNSSQPVVITSNNLTSGDNAIFIKDNSGSVTVSLNNITGNAGYAVFAEDASKEGPLNVYGNNLHNNRPGSAIDCSAKASAAVANRKANHNYWGSGLPDPVTQTHCNVTEKERLGMPIAARANKPGTDGKLVTVKEDKKYEFNNQIAFNRSGGKDFNLYILNYRFNTPGGPPFSFDLGGENPAPCSNYWNVFLPDGQTPEGTLELYFKYDRTTACMATINSDQYCDQEDNMENYPLFWYDHVSGVTDWWDVTGDRPENASSGDGQDTTCDINREEIHVSIDDTGRPSIDKDLVNAQFMVGIPLLKSFTPLASFQTVTVSWVTNNEPDVVGFYVLRGTDANHLSPVSDLIDNTGTAVGGPQLLLCQFRAHQRRHLSLPPANRPRRRFDYLFTDQINRRECRYTHSQPHPPADLNSDQDSAYLDALSDPGLYQETHAHPNPYSHALYDLPHRDPNDPAHPDPQSLYGNAGHRRDLCRADPGGI